MTTIKRLVTVVACATLFVTSATIALATPSPNGPGQPGAPGTTCGSPGATDQPPGFGTDGFANAGSVYAGSPGTPSLANGNAHAVAQYDIACFQHTQHSHLITVKSETAKDHGGG